MDRELKRIKKLYGEKFSHLCRKYFSTILEKDGLLLEILIDNFAPSHFLYDDLVFNNGVAQFSAYINNIYLHKLKLPFIVKKKFVSETPEELMDKAGYILKECRTMDELKEYRKYYAEDELLCTFRDRRINTCRVFFAVKKNVDTIKREYFTSPDRQDEYGTSVLSIQFLQDGTNSLSIKNRYNHTVRNSDATFENNLDNIIDGLTESFENTYGLVQRNLHENFSMTKYVQANNKFYKYNYKFGNVYYCPNNIIIDDGKVKEYDKEKYIILDYFILDLVNKKIFLYNDEFLDSFPDTLNDINKINITVEGDNKRITFIPQIGENIEILINNHNQIIEYKNNNITEIGNWFMNYNESLEKFSANKVESIGNSCLFYAKKLRSFEVPIVKKIGHSFLLCNTDLKVLELPEVEEFGSGVLYNNQILEIFNCGKLKKTGDRLLYLNKKLKVFYTPYLIKLGSFSLKNNDVLEEFFCPMLEDTNIFNVNEHVSGMLSTGKAKVLKK